MDLADTHIVPCSSRLLSTYNLAQLDGMSLRPCSLAKGRPEDAGSEEPSKYLTRRSLGVRPRSLRGCQIVNLRLC